VTQSAPWQRQLRWLCATVGAVILGLLIPAPCQAWGGAHRYIRKWAVERLPDEEAAFVGSAALASLHEKYTSLQDTHAGGNAPHLDPYCVVPGVRLSLHDVNPPAPTRTGMEWYFERIVEHLREAREDVARRDRAMKYLGVLCHWCEDPGSLSAHSSPVSEHVLRQLIPPPPEMQNRNYLFGYGWIGLEANVGLDDTDYRPQLIGGTAPQAAARLTHLQQRLKRHSAGLIVPAILGKVENDAKRYEAAVGKAVRYNAELIADVIYTAVFLAMQDEARGEPPEAADLRQLSLTDFLPDTDAGSTRHPYYVVPYLVDQSMDDRRALHPLEIADGAETHQPATGYGMGVPYTLPFTLAVGGEYHELRTKVGLTPQAGEHASVTFEVLIDGEPAARAGPIRRGDAGQPLRVALPHKPVFKLELRTTTDNTEYPLHNLPAWGDPTLVRRTALASENSGPR
jgi:hypothetical protein